MRRFFRFLGKKKGLRRTFSRSWTITAEAVWALLMLLGGLVTATTVVVWQLAQWGDDIGGRSWVALAVWMLVSTGLATIGLLRLLSVLWRFGASAERRGAIVSRARDVELLNQIARREADFPTVPLEGRWTRSQGDRLSFRLIARGGHGWSVLTLGLLSAAFLLITTVLAVLVYDSTLRGGTDWIGLGLSLTLGLATVWLLFLLFQAVLRQTAFGPTDLEISDLPLVCGQSYSLFLSQPSRLRLKLLDVVLECEEQATFRQGTDLRSESRVVYQQRLFRKRGVDVEPHRPFQAAFPLEVPAAAMHSFRSANNSISWRIRVTGLVKGWPAVERLFSLVVLPESAREAAA